MNGVTTKKDWLRKKSRWFDVHCISPLFSQPSRQSFCSGALLHPGKRKTDAHCRTLISKALLPRFAGIGVGGRDSHAV